MKRGLAAEFETPEALLAAVRRLRADGVTGLDACTPWPVKGLDDALELPPSKVSRVVLIAGLTGACLAYLIQWLTVAVDYPVLVGGRPAHAAPAFVLITFETTVLLAGVAALVAVFWFSDLPRPWDPLFEVPGFERASVDRFFLVVDGDAPGFDVRTLESRLSALGATRVSHFGMPEERS